MVGYVIAPGETSEQQALRRRLAQQLMEEGSSGAPIAHWAQGLNRLASAGFGGWEFFKAGEEDRKGQLQANELLTEALGALGGGGGDTSGGGIAAPSLPAAGGAAVRPAAFAPGAPPPSPAAGAAAAAGRPAPPEYTPIARQLIKSEEGYAPRAAWDVRQNSGGYGSRAAAGETFTPEKAETYLSRDMQPADAWIARHAPTAPPQVKAALSSFGYNLGVDDLERLRPQVEAQDWAGVAQRMQSFNKAAVGPGGSLQPMGGLTRRRATEGAMMTGAMPAGGSGAPQDGGSRLQIAARLMGNERTRPIGQAILTDALTRGRQKPEIVSIDLGNGQKRSMQQMPDGTLRNIDMPGMSGDGAALPPNFDDTQKLRKELTAQKNVAKFDDSIGVYQSMIQSAPLDSPASDLDLVNGLAKILDPESVVREGEFATVQRSQSIPDQLKGQLQFVFEGKGKLTPEAREKVMQIARNRMTSYRDLASKDTERFGVLARRYGMDPGLIRKDLVDVPEWKAAAAAPAPGKDGVIRFVKDKDGKLVVAK